MGPQCPRPAIGGRCGCNGRRGRSGQFATLPGCSRGPARWPFPGLFSAFCCQCGPKGCGIWASAHWGCCPPPEHGVVSRCRIRWRPSGRSRSPSRGTASLPHNRIPAGKTEWRKGRSRAQCLTDPELFPDPRSRPGQLPGSCPPLFSLHLSEGLLRSHRLASPGSSGVLHR